MIPGIRVKGIRQAKRGITSHVQEINEGLEALIAEYITKVERLAQGRVPVDAGDLRGSIRSYLVKTAGTIRGYVTAGEGLENPDVAAYVEWGTGSKVRVPPELQQYALQWYVNGEGHLPANPFLFPSFEQVWRDFVRDVVRLVQTGSTRRVKPVAR